jgi:molybdopterin-containing oxidoreductase family iron-sulfur binding subunit
MSRYGMIIDVNNCTGCMTCVLACKQEHLTGPGVSWIRVLETEDRAANCISYSPVTCMHCDNAPCIDACEHLAISKREDGIVIIDQDKCQGSGDCIEACPYGAIRINPVEGYFGTPQPFEENPDQFRRQIPGKASKCTLCNHRIDQGERPVCVDACRSGALIFGDLDDPNSEICEKLKESKLLLASKKLQAKVTYLARDSVMETIDQKISGEVLSKS